MIPFQSIDKTWTLFLDRDGVINEEKHLGYINTPEEFVFYVGVPESIAQLSRIFGRIIVVTNQRGVGKGITTIENLQAIHQKMLKGIEVAGGHIDAIYYCPDLTEDSYNRKPNPGMGHQAKNEFPEIDFEKSIMVGNTLSDMGFGRNIGAKTVFLITTRPETDLSDPRIDMSFESLSAFSTCFD